MSCSPALSVKTADKVLLMANAAMDRKDNENDDQIRRTRRNTIIDPSSSVRRRGSFLSSTSTNTTDTSVPDRKYIGVRQIVTKDFIQEHQVDADIPCQELGLQNCLIQNLIIHNPCLLGQILSTRYFSKCEDKVSDFIVSLFVEGFQNDKRNTKRRKVACNIDVELVNSVGKENYKEDYKAFGKSVDMNRSCDSDVIKEDEQRFLEDVLVEIQASRKSRKWSDVEENDVENDLGWLTNELEKEWDEFKERAINPLTNIMEICPDTNDGNKKIMTNQPRYKVSCCLNRGPRCSLGIYDSLETATLVYDKAAIWRRALGMKVLEEFEIRNRVKARKAAYITMKEIIDVGGTPQKAAEESSKAASKMLSTVKADSYLTSERVLYPDLNNYPVWWEIAVGGGIGCVEDQRLIFRRQTTGKVQEYGRKMLDDKPDLDWFGHLREDIIAPTNNVNKIATNDNCEYGEKVNLLLTSQIRRLEQELANLNIITKINNIKRLANLELTGTHILKEEEKTTKSLLAFYRCMHDKTNSSEKGKILDHVK